MWCMENWHSKRCCVCLKDVLYNEITHAQPNTNSQGGTQHIAYGLLWINFVHSSCRHLISMWSTPGLWGSLVLQKQSSSNQKGQCSFIILPRGGILKRTNRKGILGQKTHVRDIFQKHAAWEASVPWQTANLYYFLLIIWVQVPVRSQDLLVRWGLSSKVEHFPTNTLIIAGTFSRHQISLVSANVIV